MMTVITLTTDFGTNDEYAGVMKGAVLRINPRVTLVDLCHLIPPFDVMAAARMLDASFAYFPEKTVHVIVVDPGVGSSRAIVAFEMDGHFFLAPDNGIPAYLIRRRMVGQMVRLRVEEKNAHRVSTTFHGRDLFAPAAAKMADGIPLSCLGPDVDPAGLVVVGEPGHQVEDDGSVCARITAIDRFGNLITDLDCRALSDLMGAFEGRDLVATLGQGWVRGLVDHYHHVPLSRPLVVTGSRGCLEIAVNCGSAREYFKVSRGDGVRFSLVGKESHLDK